MKLSPLERTALAAILDEQAGDRAMIEPLLAKTSVLSRKNTGGGFFTDLEVASDVDDFDRRTAHFGKNVWLAIDGLEYGLGMILHSKGGRMSLLEGYAVGPEDTSMIDFGDVRFAVAREPGPLSPNDG